MPDMNGQRGSLTLVAGVLGILVAVIAIISAALAVNSHIDKNYVRNDAPEIVKIRSKFEDELDVLKEDYAKTMKSHVADIESIKGTALASLDETRAIHVSVSSLKRSAEELLKEMKEPGRILSIAYTESLGPDDEKDDGPLESRKLKFSKIQDDTTVRVGYSDNFRVSGNSKACRWEIKVNGSSCPSGALIYDRHDQNSSNVHDSGSVVGYCSGLPLGEHEFQVWISANPSHPNFVGSDCHTGWRESTWVLEAFEIVK